MKISKLMQICSSILHIDSFSMTPPPPPQSIIAFFATALISPLLSVLLKLGNEELETSFKTFFFTRQDKTEKMYQTVMCTTLSHS